MYLKKNDKVIVISGVDKGKKGTVTRVLPKTNRVVIEGIDASNKMAVNKRHLRPSQANPDGGIVERVRPISASNVMLLDPKQNVPTRVGYKVVTAKGKGKNATETTKKVRYAKKSGQVLD